MNLALHTDSVISIQLRLDDDDDGGLSFEDGPSNFSSLFDTPIYIDIFVCGT